MPSITFAAWWNPATWFKAKQPSPEISEIDNSDAVREAAELRKKVDLLEQKLSELQPEKPETKEAEETKTVVRDRVVTQTIKVDNPELQVKINALVLENNQLKQQVATVQTDYNSCRVKLSKAQDEQLSAIQQDTAQIVKNTTPPALPPSPPAPTINVGSPVCSGSRAIVPVSTSGTWEYAEIRTTTEGTVGGQAFWHPNPINWEPITLVKTYTAKLYINANKNSWKLPTDGATVVPETSGNIEVPDCK